MKNDYYAVIMAGGVGSRFWPVSKVDFPKQFHDMLGTGQTLIQRTYSRLIKSIPPQNILILTNERYSELVLEQLPEIHPRQVVTEPAMRNTAPCILYAALKIQKENPNAQMLVAPSDHWIEDEAAFTKDMQQCFDTCAKDDVLMTLGIQPAFPNTGYGYIEYDKAATSAIKKVAKFREKPDYQTAKQFIEAGNFLWNAGIFIWSVKSIVKAFAQFQPEMTTLFAEGVSLYNTLQEPAFIQENYVKSENISIDYAILEQAGNVHVLPASFDWNDLGTWGSLYDKLEQSSPTVDKNAVVNARVLANNSTGNMIKTDTNKIVVVEGLEDYIIVDEKEVLMVYPKAKEQEIKATRKEIEELFGKKYI